MGLYNDDPVINPDEVGEWKWMDVDELLVDIKETPDDYTVWFKIALAEMERKGFLR